MTNDSKPIPAASVWGRLLGRSGKSDAMNNTPAPAPAADIPERLRQLLGRLGDNLIERDTPLRLAVLAALSGEHILLVGPPGTAKSALARRMRLAFPKEEGGYFERLLTRFTVPEELFGPLSIKGLEEDRYERKTERYLPAASIGFLDEIFKANSAILNALLTLLNEREFDNGARRVKVPLVAVVGASNELPEDEELNALFDRFLFRYHVPPVSSKSFPDLLEVSRDEPTIGPEFRFTADELRQMREDAETEVSLPDNVRRLLGQLRAWCQAENIIVSDRRWRKIVTMLKMSAHSNGRKEVSIWDAWLVQHCVWEKPEQREKVQEWYGERIGTGTKTDNRALILLITGLEKTLERDREEIQRHAANGHPLFVSKSAKQPITKQREQLIVNGEAMYLPPKGRNFYFRSPQGYNQHCFVDNEERSHPVPRDGSPRGGYASREIGQMRKNDYGHWDPELYVRQQANWVMVDNAPLMSPKPHKPVYVQSKAEEVNRVLDACQQHRNFLSEQKRELENEIRGHHWVPDDFAAAAAAALDNALADADALLERVAKLQEGFASLPLEPEITGEDSERKTISPSAPARLRFRPSHLLTN